MKQSYIKAAEEAIKKAEDIKHRFQTQSRLVPGKDPDLLLEEEGFAEQIGCLHRIARIDREEAAGRLRGRLGKMKRAKKRDRIRLIRLTAVAAAVLTGVYLYPLIGNREKHIGRETYVREEKVAVPTVFWEQDEKTIDRRTLDMREVGNTYVVTAGRLSSEELSVDTPVVYERIVIPAGYIYSVALADGSTVALNAGSELRFPNRFCDSVREVELKGEGYFDVAESGRPFIVRMGENRVTVYGTRFNLFYSDRLAVTEAVLVEGSIGLTVEGKETKIRPNQRIRYATGRQSPQVEEVDVNDYIQWLADNFKYNGARLDRIAFDLSAWYGVEIQMKPEIADETYSFEFGKQLPVEEVIWALRKITGKTIEKEGGAYRIK